MEGNRKEKGEIEKAAGEEYLVSVLHGRPGFGPALLRAGLSGLAPIYSVGLKTYLLPYQLGIRQRYRLPVPVVCIGNLTTGGTGKTPMTQTICRRLQAEGRRVVVLNRGYGGKQEHGCAVVSDGKSLFLSATDAGDEAFLLASTLTGVPVLVGKDRRVTGRLACERFSPDVIVLDDGLQFWQLHRDLDIVLLNAQSPFDNGWAFPRGLLREPPSHLKRAGIVVLTNATQAGTALTEAAKAQAQRLAPAAPIFTANLLPDSLRPIGEKGRGENGLLITPLSWLKGKRVAALSAIGNPASFEELLTRWGANVICRFRFRDHQALTESDLQAALDKARRADCDVLLTTEKDAVKWPVLATPPALPIFALRVTMQIDEESAFYAALEHKLQADPQT